jgi:hypothetical protein
MRMTQRFSAAAVVLLAGGCGLFTDTDPWRLRPAMLSYFEFGENVVLPATAQRNVPFNVQFNTYSDIGCVDPTTTDVEVIGLDVRIIPVQKEWLDRDCTDEVRSETNTVSVTVTQAGPATVRIFGWQLPEDVELIAERQITVNP